MRHHGRLKAIVTFSARLCCQQIVTPAWRNAGFTASGRVMRCDTIEAGHSSVHRQAPRLKLGPKFQHLTGSKTFLMARIYPFRAWRYNPSAVRLEDVVTQPYDKISPAMQQAYYQRSPFNLVRIILGLPELFDAERGENVYTRAARDFRAWREQGVLIQENEPCVFAYAQRFTVPGTEMVKERRGFIALGKLHDYADQVVFRHEQTLSKPKSDRLNLLKATQAHFGQIFMLYSDPAGQRGEDSLRRQWRGRRRSHRRVRRAAPGVARQQSGGHPSAGHGHGRQEADHRRRPPPLRNGAELLQRTPERTSTAKVHQERNNCRSRSFPRLPS